MGVPCPACKHPLGLTLPYIAKNPICKCPKCETVLNFSSNEKMLKEFNAAFEELEQLKKQYSNIAKFY